MDISELKLKFPLGMTFDYLGRNCKVYGHSQFYPMIGHVLMLKARYADEKGVIREIEFSLSELPALAQQSAASPAVVTD